jgi:hypothetical protein
MLAIGMGEAARICKEEMQVRAIVFARDHITMIICFYTCMAFRALGGFGRQRAMLTIVQGL